ncbi:epimerase [Mycobacterium sp. MS1601]|uniref:NAD-dependent epimerase/dehydratase family protein n=1 Tax=Mycobacterium sp. MS1601 TaxID=1936029 RepID=UPI0009793812|nr:NAD-dependent epimerase/dehydratase family protein [Mycobacterium sp. MS1601]AQA05502.1 epimerase [Mycobacterium sp. MS1601]
MAIFVTGAAGYIGGAIAARLIQSEREVRGLVRTDEKARQLSDAGITPVFGSLDDTELLACEAHQSEMVINAADSDHRGAVEALIEGLAGSGKPLLHTSGTGMLAQDTGGGVSDRLLDDDSPYLSAVDDAHRSRAEIDELVTAAVNRGIRSVALCNTCIYGHGQGLHQESIMVPWLMKQARADGVARYIGKGQNKWSNVHIDDVVDLYLLAAAKAPGGNAYLVENGESSFADIAEAISQRLQLAPPQSWSVDEAAAQCGAVYAYIFGSNCRVVAKRARAELNWRPKHHSMTTWIRQAA